MISIDEVDLATFCGRIGNLYGRYGLCPPFALHAAAQGWMAREIPLSHCVDVIEQFLSRHAGSCYSGSGDWNFAWLNSLIQTSWHERSLRGRHVRLRNTPATMIGSTSVAPRSRTRG
jgi:hypothetical protein